MLKLLSERYPNSKQLEDLAACRSHLQGGSRSFYAASLFLPQPMGHHACGLYAFCREADDVIDEGDDQWAALESLKSRLDAIYAGEPYSIAADRAVAAVVAERNLPRELLDALLEGFAWDAKKKEYHDFSSVVDYSVRVAGTVGVMMAVLMGTRSKNMLARASDLGIAMQLTNIARDVGEDARAGRLYLPRKWLIEAGIDPEEFLARPVFSEELGSVVARLLSEADKLYERADSGIRRIPVRCRVGMHAARLLYSAIGDQVIINGYDSVNQRAVVPLGLKLRRLMSLFRVSALSPDASTLPALPEAQFLIDSVNSDAPAEMQPPWYRRPFSELDLRIGWLFDLFGELDTRDRQLEKK